MPCKFAYVVFAVLMAAAILSTAVFPVFGPVHRAAIWGGVLLASLAGWGGLVARLAYPGQRVDLGLRLAWGSAALLAIGGVACLAAVATRPALLALVVAGVVAEYGYRLGWLGVAPEPLRATRWSAATVAALAVAMVLAGVQYYGGATGLRLQENDDWVSYLVYPKKIIATGTLIEPFSIRRLAAYGGQSLLQALTLIGSANVLQIPLLDMGICLIIVLALVIGDRGREPPGLWLLPVLLVVTLSNIRTNSTSVMSGVVFFLALFRTASAPALAERPLRRGAVLGLLAAAAATLRQSFIVPACAFLAILYTPAAWQAFRAPHGQRRSRLASAVIAPVAMLVCLLPWALLSQRSSATVLFPLFSGNYHPEYGRWTSADLVGRLTFLWENVRHAYPIAGRSIFFLAALLVPWHATGGALAAVTWAALLGFVAIVCGFPLSDVWSMSRYYFGFVIATVLAVAMHVGSLQAADWRRDRLRVAVPALLVITATIVQVVTTLPQTARDYAQLAGRIVAAIRRPASLFDQDSQTYQLMQSRVPPGAPMLVMLDRPYWLDFGRNPIDVIDLPGNVSPPPGMSFAADDTLVAYLTARGVRFVAFVKSEQSKGPYRRWMWEGMLGSPLWSAAAPRYLQAFSRFESLPASHARLYDDGEMVLVDLGAAQR